MIKDKLKGKTMTDQLATLTTDEDVSIITLDDGKANVFSAKMSETINSLLDQVPEAVSYTHLTLPTKRIV